jgi:hypothetical protein
MLLFAVLACVAFVGCVALTPEQQETLEQLSRDIKDTHAEAEVVAAQIERVYILQQEVREQYEKGELTPEAAMKRLAELGKEAKEAAAHYAFLKEKGGSLLNDYKKLKEQGVPWYYTAWTIISSIAALWLGKSAFGLKGALADVIRGVEKGGDVLTKKAIAGASNGIVTRMVKRLTPAKSANKT